MQTQRVIIRNNRNEKLVGYLYKGTSKTLIIACHGLESNNYPIPPLTPKQVADYFKEISAKTGASVFSFDFSGFGESEGKKFISFKKRDSEIKTVFDYFSSKYEKVILYGFSLGGASIAIAASKYNFIHGLIAINGFYKLHPKNMYKANVVLLFSLIFSNILYIKELYYLTKYLKADKITVPTLVIHSDKDNFVKPSQSVNFFNKLRTEKKLIVIKSKDHNLEKENLQIPPKIAQWMRAEKLV